MALAQNSCRRVIRSSPPARQSQRQSRSSIRKSGSFEGGRRDVKESEVKSCPTQRSFSGCPPVDYPAHAPLFGLQKRILVDMQAEEW